MEVHGFCLHGIAAAEPAERAGYVRAWLAAGQHGEMRYLAEHAELRLDVGAMMPGVRSVLVVADAYGGTSPPPGEPRRPAAPLEDAPSGEGGSRAAGPRGRTARYAWGRDYHRETRQRLHRLSDALREAHPGHDFRATVDTAPVMEREHAQRAGVGFVGKHTLIIHPRHGSFLLLGCILTTAELAATPRPQVSRNQCGNCTRCIDACPTSAIAPEGFQLDATRCISYLTLEHRSAIDPALHTGMGDWIAGCDVCQNVCPFNTIGSRNPLPVPLGFRPRAHSAGLDLIDVLRWDENDRFNHVSGTSLMRIKLWMWKRNALIAAGNALAEQADPGLTRAIEARRDDPHPVVRETAAVVLDGIRSEQPARGRDNPACADTAS